VTAPLRIGTVLFIFVVLASAVSADSLLSIDPPAPTSDDEIVVRVPRTCQVDRETVTRNGTEISVLLEQLRSCPSPPFRDEYEVSLGKLPPGEYRVSVTEYSDLPPQVLSFFVFEANPPLTVRPFVVPVDTPGFPIHLALHDDFVLGTDGAWVIEIGGVQYREEDWLPAVDGLGFYAPDLAPGLHDIRVIRSDGSIVDIPAAIYYQSPAAAADRGVFERVLFPVLFRGGGSNGSQWRSEAVISNPTEYSIVTANMLVPQKRILAPGSRHAFSGEQYPNGVALLVPRRDAEDLALQLRIRDASRESDSFGTEVPVVREAQMFHDEEITLLDVPLDPRYRTRLRVYFFPDAAAEQWPSNVTAWIQPADGGERFFVYTRLTHDCSGAACAWTPLYGELDLPARGNGARADVYVSGVDGGLEWAFASVTNNKTQEVTLVTPNGRGGRP
jgi:hypothetical protein